MFYDRVEASPHAEAYQYPVDDVWHSVTWAETGDRVTNLAAGLVALGVQPEQRVAIAAATRYDWVLADLAIMAAGAATTTIYPTTVTDEVAFIVADSGSRVVFAEDDTQIDKLREHRADLPDVAHVVTFDGTPDGDWIIGLDDLARRGEKLLTDQPDAVTERVDAIQPQHLATLLYTSGTTGTPKGVRLPHSAWTYEGTAIQQMNLLYGDDLQYLWLPLAHSFGKVLLTAQLAIGFPTAVDGRVEKIVDNLGKIQPTFMGAAPRIFEKVHGRINAMTAAEGGLKKKIFDRAFTVGLEVRRREAAGESVPALLAVQHRVLDKLVFTKIRERFGGRVRFFISGAAGLNSDIAHWFEAAGVLVMEGYGLTETSAGTCVNRPHNYKLGTVGPPLPGSVVRAADDGELLVQGPGVMDGYHNMPELTQETLVDGWFHTGDVGEVDADGYVRVTDRKKDLFKTSGGKYVVPQSIEAQFKALCPYASHFVVHGADRHFCTALITLDEDAIGDWAPQHGLAGRSYGEIARSEAARGMVQEYIDRLNAGLNRWETIKRFVILDHDLSVEQGEITPSQKVKRPVIEERYRDQLDSLYAES